MTRAQFIAFLRDRLESFGLEVRAWHLEAALDDLAVVIGDLEIRLRVVRCSPEGGDRQ